MASCTVHELAEIKKVSEGSCVCRTCPHVAATQVNDVKSTAMVSHSGAASAAAKPAGSAAAAGCSKKRLAAEPKAQHQAFLPAGAAVAAGTGAARGVPAEVVAEVMAKTRAQEAATEQATGDDVQAAQVVASEVKRRKVPCTGAGDVGAIGYPWAGYPYNQVLNLDILGTAEALVNSAFHNATPIQPIPLVYSSPLRPSPAAAFVGSASIGGGSSAVQASAAPLLLNSPTQPAPAAHCGPTSHCRGYAANVRYSQALPPRAPSQPKPLILDLSRTASGAPHHPMLMQPPLNLTMPGGRSAASVPAAAAAPAGAVSHPRPSSLPLDQAVPQAAHAAAGWAPSRAQSPSLLPAAVSTSVVPQVVAATAAAAAERSRPQSDADAIWRSSPQAADFVTPGAADAGVAAASVVHACGGNRRKARQPTCSAAQ